MLYTGVVVINWLVVGCCDDARVDLTFLDDGRHRGRKARLLPVSRHDHVICVPLSQCAALHVVLIDYCSLNSSMQNIYCFTLGL